MTRLTGRWARSRTAGGAILPANDLPRSGPAIVSGGALGIALQNFAGLSAADFVAAAREAESRGYHSAWTGEAAGADAVTLSALVLGATERLHMATGVLPIQTRTPVILGMTAATKSAAGRPAKPWSAIPSPPLCTMESLLDRSMRRLPHRGTP